VVKDEKGGLQFLVHPELRKTVGEEDLGYIDSLLKDFLERARLHPEALFQQLCSLAAGPLIAQEAGSQLGDFPRLLELSEKFVEA
jgi:hypothetical protein